MLWLVVTRRCQMACLYCYQGSHGANPHIGPLHPGTEAFMSREVADLGMAWAVDWPHTRSPLHVQLYGGEPTLAWPLVDYLVPRWNVHFAREAGRAITWGMTTNGVGLTPKRRDWLDQYGVDLLVSIDGPQRTHDQVRVRHDGSGTWDDLDAPGLARWRPTRGLELAWQLDPARPVYPADLDELIALGFRRINFNINWLSPWDWSACEWLRAFIRHAGRLAMRGGLQSNLIKRATRAIAGQRMVSPCGLGTGMLALTTEGHLYPSQEMAFTVYEPGRASGTPEWYRVGDVRKTPVLDVEAQARVGGLLVEHMRPSPEFECSSCVASGSCLGGCHCRYVGQDGVHPGGRYSVPVGLCQSSRAEIGALLEAAVDERWTPPGPRVSGRSLLAGVGLRANNLPTQPNGV